MGILDGIVNRATSDAEYRASSGIMGAIDKKLSEGKTPKCPKCGKPIESGLKFCANCGTALRITCAKCNADYPVGTKFCTSCGGPLK